MRNVSVLAGGTAIGQTLIILASPLLTRLYTPEDFGLLAMFVSLLSIFAVVASLRYALAIPLPDDDTIAANVLVLSLSIVLVTSLLSAAVIWLLAGRISIWTNSPALGSYLWLLPLGVLSLGAYQSFNYWAIRKKAFTRIARTKLSQGVATASTQLGLGFLSIGPIGLLIGHLAGQASGTTTLVMLALRSDIKAIRQVSLVGMLAAAKRYRRFPLLSTWSGLANTLSTQVPVLMLSLFFGPLVTGFYALGNRVLQAPMGLVGRAISQVFFASASEAMRNDTLRELTAKTFGQLVRVGLPPILLIGFAAPELFGFFFGEQWREAGQYAQYLSPWLFLVFVSSPLSILPSLLEKQSSELIFQGGLLAARIAGLAIGGFTQDIMLAIGLYAGLSTVFYLWFTLWNLSLSGCDPVNILTGLIRELILSLPFCIPVILAKTVIFSPNRELLIVISSGIGAFLFICRLIACRNTPTYFR